MSKNPKQSFICKACAVWLVIQSSATPCNPVDCSPPGSSVHGDSPRILEWVAMSSSRGFPNLEIEHSSPALQADSLPSEPPEKPKNTGVGSLSLLQGIFLTQEWTGIQTGVSCNLGSLLTSWVTREALYVCKLCISLNLFTFTVLYKGQPTPVFLLGESHGQRSLAGYSHVISFLPGLWLVKISSTLTDYVTDGIVFHPSGRARRSKEVKKIM